MTERKFQLVMNEREAEIIGAAMGIALLILETARPEKGLALGEYTPEMKLALVMSTDDAENLACEASVFCGVPCPKHHNKTVRQEDASAGQVEGMKFLAGVRKHIDDFAYDFRREQVKKYSADNPQP